MKQCWLVILALATLGLGASCSQVPRKGRIDYAAPTLNPVRSGIATAQDHLTSARTHITKSSGATAAAAKKAKTAQDRLVVVEKAVAKDEPTHTLVLQVQQDVDSLTADLLTAKTENDALTVDVQASQTSLAAAQTRAADLQKQINTQTADLNEANRIRNLAIDQATAANAHVHKLKFWICTLAAAATLLLVTRFTGFLAPLLGPYALILYVAAPAAVFGVLWWRL